MAFVNLSCITSEPSYKSESSAMSVQNTVFMIHKVGGVSVETLLNACKLFTEINAGVTYSMGKQLPQYNFIAIFGDSLLTV